MERARLAAQGQGRGRKGERQRPPVNASPTAPASMRGWGRIEKWDEMRWQGGPARGLWRVLAVFLWTAVRARARLAERAAVTAGWSLDEGQRPCSRGCRGCSQRCSDGDGDGRWNLGAWEHSKGSKKQSFQRAGGWVAGGTTHGASQARGLPAGGKRVSAPPAGCQRERLNQYCVESRWSSRW